MPVITAIEDLKRLHKRRVPRMFFDYCESGSYTEQTFRDNVSDFGKLRLRQKVAVDMSNRTIAGTMLGQPVTMPVALAPVGLTGMQSADGEIKAARAAVDVRTHVVVLRITYFEEYYYKLRLMYELRAYAADCTCMGMSRNL